MNYKLNTGDQRQKNEPIQQALRRLAPLMAGEGRTVLAAFCTILVTSLASLAGPLIIGHVVDTYIQRHDYSGVLGWTGILLAVYAVSLVGGYLQTRLMGGAGRRILYHLRNTIFLKLQELPVAFFSQNKSGDLISRINSDTDKINQFVAQALMQFLSNFFLIVGAGIFLVVLNVPLGLAALAPAAGVLILTRVISPWVKRASFASLQSLGGLSGEIQESLANFKVIIAFNRLDYFKRKFDAANVANYAASIRAGAASNVFIPLYGLAYNLGQIVVLGYGIALMSSGNLTAGLLVGFLLYVNNFYNPLRQLAAIWASLQLALAALDRISEVLAMQPDLPVLAAPRAAGSSLLEFKNVSFHYPDGKDVLHQVSLTLERGKTYALIGPTGGGKTTTASLMARLYDPSAGMVLLDGKDIRAYQPAERAEKIGFILQEPFLFTGTVRDNIIYANTAYADKSAAELVAVLEKAGLSGLMSRFDEGFDTPVAPSGDSVSLGQKQLIAFMRAALRNPELLILDEATANIDTVTEQLLDDILGKLPASTTKVIIAHRLNTIKDADEIFFINAGKLLPAGSLDHAVAMLLHGEMHS